MAAANYPGIGEIGELGGAEKPHAPATPAEPSLAEKLAVSEGQREQAERLLRERPASTPVRRLAPQGPPEPGPIPDQATDPEGFSAWHERDRAYERWRSEQNTNSVRDAAVQAGRGTEILNAYMTSRPKYQGLRSLVIQCFREACEDLKINDGDLPENTTSLDTAVDRKMRDVVKTAAAAVDDLPVGGENDGKDEKGKQGKETPPSRTEELSAGSRGGSAGGKTEKDGERKPKDMVEVMLDRQAESPFF